MITVKPPFLSIPFSPLTLSTTHHSLWKIPRGARAGSSPMPMVFVATTWAYILTSSDAVFFQHPHRHLLLLVFVILIITWMRWDANICPSVLLCVTNIHANHSPMLPFLIRYIWLNTEPGRGALLTFHHCNELSGVVSLSEQTDFGWSSGSSGPWIISLICFWLAVTARRNTWCIKTDHLTIQETKWIKREWVPRFCSRVHIPKSDLRPSLKVQFPKLHPCQ